MFETVHVTHLDARAKVLDQVWARLLLHDPDFIHDLKPFLCGILANNLDSYRHDAMEACPEHLHTHAC